MWPFCSSCACALIVRAGTLLRPDLHDPPMSTRRVDHPLALAQDVGQGLLDVDVLAGGARHDRHQRVPVVGRRDDYGVDVASVEHPAEVVEPPPARCPPSRRRRRIRSSETSQIPAISQSGCARKSSRCRRPISPMPMKPTRTRSLAPATRCATRQPSPARCRPVVLRKARRCGMRRTYITVTDEVGSIRA